MVRIFNLETAKLSYTLLHSDMPVTSVRWRPQSSATKTMNMLTSGCSDGTLQHWHATSGKCLYSHNCGDGVNTIDYSYDGNLLAAAGQDTYIRVYDETTKQLALTMREKGDYPGHSNRIFCVKFNPLNQNQLVSGGWDHTLLLNDLRVQGPVASISGPKIFGDAIDFRNDGHTLLTGSCRRDDALQLWDLRACDTALRTYDWEGPDGMGGVCDQEGEGNQ